MYANMSHYSGRLPSYEGSSSWSSEVIPSIDYLGSSNSFTEGLESTISYSSASVKYDGNVLGNAVSFQNDIRNYSPSGWFPSTQYGRNEYVINNNSIRNMPMGYHNPTSFLNPFREDTQFIGNAKEIEDLIKDAFWHTMNEPLSSHIKISVLDDKDFIKVFNRNSRRGFSPGIQGFCLHATKELFVRSGKLDKVMVVIGHEIGHLLTNSLPSIINEEAKAFSFERAWLQAIVENNIGGIANNINLNFNPANNGVHDVAFRFVKRRLNEGKSPLSLFFELSNHLDGVIDLF